MNEQIKNKNNVIVESRSMKVITCPHCWTDQRTERDFCYRCGAEFIYLSTACIALPQSERSRPSRPPGTGVRIQLNSQGTP